MKTEDTNHNLSLGFRTEMIFHRFDGEVIDRGTYIVVKTPSQPGFYYGNLVIFFKAPKQGSLAEWRAIFSKEFRDSPAVKHVTFLWDSPAEGSGDVSELTAAGFQIEYSVVLTARSVHPPPKMNSEVEIRVINSDAEWREVTENQIRSKAADFGEANYRSFKERQMARYRLMSEQGLGHWFGAFWKGKLVGNLGLYADGMVGRFQSVETELEFRRQGICGRLVYEAAQYGFQRMGLQELVMIADQHYHAAKIYESVGFKPVAKEYSAFWWDKGTRQ